MRVLVVEDVCVQGEGLTEYLRARGHAADWAANAESALSRLAVHPYDALVIDQYMPGLDGTGLLRLVRSQEATRGLPVVLTTAAADSDPVVEEIRRVLPSLRPAALVRKPFDPGQVAAALDSLTPRPA